MGACYSKSGHQDTSNPDKRPKERKKGSHKNGHAGSNHKPRLIVEDFDSIQKDVSDTVYTEDSHTINGLDVDNLLHKSQQTSLDMLARESDASRDCEVLTACDSSEHDEKECNSKDQIADCDDKHEQDTAEQTKTGTNTGDADLVVISDSGVVIETCSADSQINGNHSHENVKHSDINVKHNSEHIITPETSITCTKTPKSDSKITSDYCEINKSDLENKINSDLNSGEYDSKMQGKSQTEHSSSNYYHDLDKLKLAVRQTNNSTPADQWSLSDSLDAGFELSDQSQPIRAMKMDGRDVVVMDQEVFSQIIDEIQFLKMELSQLTEVIQDADPSLQGNSEGASILSST